MAEVVRFPGAFLSALIESGRGRRVTARCRTCGRYTEQVTVPDVPPGSPPDGLPMMELFTRGYVAVCLGCRALNCQSEPFGD